MHRDAQRRQKGSGARPIVPTAACSVVALGAAEPIRTLKEWNARRNEHRVTAESLPYKNTFGLPILSVEALRPPVRYTHPRGAVGIVIYR